MIHYQTWPPQAILVSDLPIFLNLLLCNRLAQVSVVAMFVNQSGRNEQSS
jgi:hypothetical protein